MSVHRFTIMHTRTDNDRYDTTVEVVAVEEDLAEAVMDALSMLPNHLYGALKQAMERAS